MLGKYHNLICIKILLFFLFLDLNFKSEQFHEINNLLIKNLKLESKTESNKFNINNINNVTQILSQVSDKIKIFNNPPFGDHLNEPCAVIILKFFFYINETGHFSPKSFRIRNQLQYNAYKIANMITLFSIIITIPSIFLLASDNWKKRLFACIAFQMKNILDYIDGPIIRNFTTPNVSMSFNLGRFLDGLASGTSFFFFFTGSCIYIFRSLDLVMLSLSRQEYNRLNIFHKFWYGISNFFFRMFSISNLNLYSKLPQNNIDSKDKIRLVKEVYNKITIFLVYFFLSGIQWNWNLDNYRTKFSTRIISEVKSNHFLIFIELFIYP